MNRIPNSEIEFKFWIWIEIRIRMRIYSREICTVVFQFNELHPHFCFEHTIGSQDKYTSSSLSQHLRYTLCSHCYCCWSWPCLCLCSELFFSVRLCIWTYLTRCLAESHQHLIESHWIQYDRCNIFSHLPATLTIRPGI